ncbi:MAG TPA: hypothetical protein VFR80_02795, partial [Pyrinomonadaceae bacterium]|nr:hypothetical protein [Pyrinomonadaceae bacterium]
HLRTPRDLEAMPFPLNGRATGFEDMLKEEERLGELNYQVPPIQEVAAQDLVDEAYKELRGRKELAEEYERVSKVEQRWGY